MKMDKFIDPKAENITRIRMSNFLTLDWETTLFKAFQSFDDKDEVLVIVILEINNNCNGYAFKGPMSHVWSKFIDSLRINISNKVYISINEKRYVIWRTRKQLKRQK